jgi:NADPH2 dehydrogenase
MGMKNPIPTFSHFVTELRRRQPDLAYLHVIDSRMDDTKPDTDVVPSIDFARHLWKGKPLIVAGNFDPTSALAEAERHEDTLVAFGRYFISNVRLVFLVILFHDLTNDYSRTSQSVSKKASH